MHTMISDDFWGDPEVEELDAEQKLSLLWLMTNPRRDLCGFTETSKRRFEFETALPFSALRSACEGVSKGFVELEEGLYWVRNYAAKQIGRGDKMVRNNIAKSMIKQLALRSEGLQLLFLEEYPEANELVEKLSLEDSFSPRAATPPQGVSKGKEKEKEKEKVEGERAPKGFIQKIVTAYPKQSHFRESHEAVAAGIERNAKRKEISERESAEQILAGTEAVAAKLREWPITERQRYAPTPPNFFNGDRWADDPDTFESRGGSNSPADDTPPTDLGGREARKVTDLRNPNQD